MSDIFYQNNNYHVKSDKLAIYFNNVVLIASGVSSISCSTHFIITFQIAPTLNAII